jgi:hypothetical protein
VVNQKILLTLNLKGDTMIRVACETREFKDRDGNLNGKTANEVYDALKQLMDLPPKSELNVRIKKNGGSWNDASWSDTVDSDDQLEFVKPSRDKGLALAA